jgi:sulfatase modifying factor 1
MVIIMSLMHRLVFSFYPAILFMFVVLLSCERNDRKEYNNNNDLFKASLMETGLSSIPQMVYVKSGTLIKDETESPNKIKIDAFYIDRNLVTVADFAEFVRSTGYITEAEKFGNSAVFDFQTGEWILKDSATYLYPFGKDQPKAELEHPVTQVSWNDAAAYAKYKRKRLPTANEWEWAASSGGEGKGIYAWGNSMKEGAVFKANFWQGEFPLKNTVEDGFITTSPIGYFGPNAIGINDMGGNVWQWTSDKIAPSEEEAKSDPAMRVVTKGGSFLCDPEVCHGFKVNGKSSSTPETGLVHTGFRCVKDVN